MLDRLQIPDKLRKKIDRELEPREVIKWIDQPIPRFFTAVSIVSFLFGIPWTAFTLFWIWTAAGFGSPLVTGFSPEFVTGSSPQLVAGFSPQLVAGFSPQLIFPLFGLPFLLIGFCMLLSPVWVWRTAFQTVYLITDKRAISIEGGLMTTVRSYLPEQLKDVYYQESNDGVGNVVITIGFWKDSDGDKRKEEIGFMGIRNPKDVERMLKELADTAPYA